MRLKDEDLKEIARLVDNGESTSNIAIIFNPISCNIYQKRKRLT